MGSVPQVTVVMALQMSHLHPTVWYRILVQVKILYPIAPLHKKTRNHGLRVSGKRS